MDTKQEIVVLGMGGTIAGRATDAADNVGYVAGEVPVDALVAQCLTGTLDRSVCALRCEQVVQKDSKDMVFDDWLRLSQRIAFHLGRAEVRGVVVTHGTDTLEEAAYFLHLTVPRDLQCAKPIALTCAMRPASSLAPDGPQNLRDAVAAVFSARAVGVCVVCAGEIHAATRVRKSHTYSTQAFTSVGGGVLGFVEEAQVRWADVQAAVARDAGSCLLAEAPVRWPRVEVVLSYAHASGDMVEALLAYRGVDGPVDGLVLAATGNGTLHARLEEAVKAAQGRGTMVRVVSRCVDGALVGSGHAALAFAPGQVVSPFQARIAMVLQLLAVGKMGSY